MVPCQPFSSDGLPTVVGGKALPVHPVQQGARQHFGENGLNPQRTVAPGTRYATSGPKLSLETLCIVQGECSTRSVVAPVEVKGFGFVG